jgi:cytochrome b6-f complex iron-sulfur subunit
MFVVPSAFTSCEKESVDPDDNNQNLDLTIDLTDDKYSALGSEGGFVKEDGIIVINTGEAFIALSAVCTHQGCMVGYDHGDGNLPCPCHGSVFSITGSVLEGPADSPLKTYELTQEGDLLTIVL